MLTKPRTSKHYSPLFGSSGAPLPPAPPPGQVFRITRKDGSLLYALGKAEKNTPAVERAKAVKFCTSRSISLGWKSRAVAEGYRTFLLSLFPQEHFSIVHSE